MYDPVYGDQSYSGMYLYAYDYFNLSRMLRNIQGVFGKDSDHKPLLKL